MPAPETFLPDLEGLWRATDTSGGPPPTSLTDLSGNARDMTCSGLTISTDGGLVSLLSAGAAAATAAAAADWVSFHDGTGFTVWIVARTTSTGTQHCLVDTGAASSAKIGAGIFVDATKGRASYQVTRGTAGTVAFKEWSWPGNIEAIGERALIVVRWEATQTPELKIWVNGALVLACSAGVNHVDGAGPAFNPADPTHPLKLFAMNTSGAEWAGHWHETGIMSSPISDADRAILEAWARDTYGVADRSAWNARPQLLVDGNSLAVLSGGELRAKYAEDLPGLVRRAVRARKAAVFGLKTGEMADRYAAHVAPLFDPKTKNILVAWEGINSIASGQLVTGDGGGHSPEDVYDAYAAYCAAARADGWRVIAVMCTPSNTDQADTEAFNALLLANWRSFADVLARPDLDPIMGSWTVWADDLGPQVYRSDGTHQTDAGGLLYLPWFVAAANALLAAASVRTSLRHGQGLGMR